MTGITRIHGTGQPGTFHGGYQLAFFTVESTLTNFATSYTVTNSNFEKAVKGIEAVATVVVLGTPTAAGFTVGIDGGSYYGRGDTTGFVDNSVTTLQTAINSVLTTTNATVASVAIAGKTFA
jgi:hypothetical protein